MQSMTGYGRRQCSRDGREITVELKTVNHRFLDISCRLPRALSFAEDAVRKTINASLRRGHVDITITYLNLRADAREVRVDMGLAAQYQKALDELADATGMKQDCGLSFVAAQPDVLNVTVCEEDQEAVLELLKETLDLALSDVQKMRAKEGVALREDLSFHLGEVKRIRDEIAVLAPQVPLNYQEKLKQRLNELGVKEIPDVLVG